MKRAVLVIDMQNDFVDGAIPVKGIQGMIPALQEFLEKARQKGYMVIFTRHSYDPDKNIIEQKLFPELEMRGLRKNTPGWEIHPALQPLEGELIIDKERYDAFHNTILEEVLRQQGISSIIITGTMTEVCCESTARGAMFRDFEVLFASDLTVTSDPERHRRTLEVIDSHFGWVKTASEILHEE